MSPFAGYKDFAECVAQNQDKRDPDAYCGSIKHKVEKQHPDEYPEDWGSDAPYQTLEEIEAQVEKLLKDGGCPPGQHKHGGHNYCHPEGRKHRSHAGEAVHGLKYPKEQTTRPRAPRLPMKQVGEIRRLMDAGWAEPKDLGNKLMNVAERLRGKVSQDVLALLRHASGRLQAGDMEDGMLYVDQAFRRYRDEITGGREAEGRTTAPTDVTSMDDKSLLKYHDDLMRAWKQAATQKPESPGHAPMSENEQKWYYERARDITREIKTRGLEQRMKKAEKKRDDAEPTVTYDEPFAEIYDVDNRLKAVTKALKRQIKRQTEPNVMRPSARQISGELQNIEKRVRKLPGCC